MISQKGCVSSLLEIVKRHGGCIVLLWHNAGLDSFGHKGYANVYKQALNWIADNDGIAKSVKEIVEIFNINEIKYDF